MLGTICPSAPTCPSGYSVTTAVQDIVPNSSGGFTTCPGYDCVNASGQDISEVLNATSPCNQALLWVQPGNLILEGIALALLVAAPGLAKALALAPIGLLLVSNISSRMDYDSTGKCVVMSSGL
jgi:hypothetical protein